MTAQLAPTPIFKGWDNNGFPLAFGFLTTYAAGTTTPQATYVDSTQTTQNQNPQQLNFRGEMPLWLNPLLAYKFLLTDVAGNIIPGWPVDNVQGGIGVASNIVPSQTNTFTLGTPTITFANAYFGPNGAPVFDPASGNIGYYAPTPAEIARAAALSVPITTVVTDPFYFPGHMLRYGADPTGVASAVAAILNAINSNSQVYFPDGSYKVDSTITINPGSTLQGLLIYGSGKTRATLVLAAAAGINATILNFAVQLFLDVRIQSLGFSIPNSLTGQTGIQFSQVRGLSRVYDCQINGSTGSTGIQFDGSGTFTAQFQVEKCQVANHLVGISLAGSVTDITIRDNAINQGTTIAGSVAISIANTVSAPRIEDNEIQGWTTGINSAGTYVMQARNYFENNTKDFIWARGSGNAFIANTSVYDTNPSAGLQITVPSNNVDQCAVIRVPQQGGISFDDQTIAAGLGYSEHLRAFNLGDFQTPSFSAGNFTANGSMSWAVTSGEVATYSYSIAGHTMTVSWFISSSTIAGTPNTQLQIAIPGGFVASTRVWAPCQVQNNGTLSTGLAEVQASGTVINIYANASTSTNWTASSSNGGTMGSITFQVN